MSLQTYQEKRHFARTPEPKGRVKRTCGSSFVVQKHAASHLHYDFRLELDGVLLSWAVPKGPSLDPSHKRLAMQTEDHPVEYGGFEGIIPKGEYGGGTVMVWDQGTWEAEGDARASYARGRLTFTLHGKKLKGKWHLIRTKNDDSGRSRWFLFKGADAEARRGGAPIVDAQPSSAVTGRSLEEIANAADRTWHSKSADHAGPAPATVRITHAERIVYPDDGFTKGDVAAYYARVAGLMLPHIAGRPLMLVRCPSDIGKCFYQKHHNGLLPKAVRGIDVGGELEHTTVDDHAGLMALAQSGVVEIHTWGCHADAVERPDIMVLDLDPDPSVPWKDVVAAARTVRGRLEQIGLHAFVKTTGGKGLHVCCAFQTSWDEMKMLARAIAESIVRDEPDRYVATMSKARRKGKIFIDHFRNGRGSTFVAPFSLRARPGAPVAMPLAWEELSARAKPDHFTLANVEARLERLGTQGDPWRSLGDMRRTRARDPSRRPVAQR